MGKTELLGLKLSRLGLRLESLPNIACEPTGAEGIRD